ncbi:hypothetical protein MHM88_17210 [Epibacterium sp. MM17-32]|uniref:hypothetical protein n=1 Tax=Epibacterium sp. MM17-32 TaxID=2917734 RepID=UPI001EF4A8A5|nr:hypothetical protein [Epibacterium sp. MM17-32]MCG7629551.1 hypothetical protein [Epibacterium sp. MM17-32]
MTDPLRRTTPGPDHIDAVWKRLTTQANAAFDANDLSRAQPLYDRALQEAQWRFRTDRDSATLAGAPPMLVAASANAADCHARAGMLTKAAQLTFDTLDALRDAMSSVTEPPAFRLACFQHLKPALCDYAHCAGSARVAPALIRQTALRTRDAALAFVSENRTRH